MTAMLIHGGGAQHLLVALMLIGLSPGPAGLLLRAPPSCTSALTSARDPATKKNYNQTTTSTPKTKILPHPPSAITSAIPSPDRVPGTPPHIINRPTRLSLQRSQIIIRERRESTNLWAFAIYPQLIRPFARLTKELNTTSPANIQRSSPFLSD